MDTTVLQIGQSLPQYIADRTLGNPPHFFLLVQSVRVDTFHCAFAGSGSRTEAVVRPFGSARHASYSFNFSSSAYGTRRFPNPRPSAMSGLRAPW